MDVANLAKQFGKTISKNSPAILTAMAVTGTVSTAVFATKATIDSVRDYDTLTRLQANEVRMDKRDIVRRYWVSYVPAVATCGVTIACIVGANTVHTRRSAALMSAYSLTETAFKEYQEKVVETVGVAKEQKVRDSVAQDRVANNPIGQNEVFVTGTGEVHCYESITGRYFKSNMESLRKAMNDVNAQIMNEMYASQNDFFRAIGLAVTGTGETVGWNTDKRLDLQFSSVLDEKGEPCLAVGYANLPFPQYDDLH